jgi:predicted phosphoribosyltransferase
MTPTIFANRRDAGRFLASKLSHYANHSDVVVLALPRGGVPVGYEVARALNVPLDVFMVRKLGAPQQPELAIGAIATGGVRVVSPELIDRLGVTRQQLEAIAADEEAELERREREFRGDRPSPSLDDKTVILVDDGLATGSTMRAAAAALRQQHPAKIVAAVPTAAPDTCEEFRNVVDEVICGITPDRFLAVGQWYEDFSQTTDQEVRDLLIQAAEAGSPHHPQPV